MDNGPFRMGNSPAPGRSAGRPVAAARNEAAARPAHRADPEEPREPIRHSTPVHHSSPKKHDWIKSAIIGVATLLAVVVLILGWMWFKSGSSSSGIDAGKYQAVFFTNGQVYFGKLHTFNQEYMKLTDIYYLQTQAGEAGDTKNPQKTTSDQNNVQLIKLGDEIHGPEDEMLISKDQMLFFENLKQGGKVAESIKKHKNTN